MAVNLSPVGGAAAQFFTNSGVILSGGKLYTYAAGTTTPQTTYTSSTGNTAHTNPIILDSAGRVPGGEIWLTVGVVYKFLLKDSTDVLIGTYDNVQINTDASLVTYTPTGTGAVTRTVQAKLRDTVSVKDFGAVGDGSTDDSAAFNAALTASYLVSVPNGTYKIKNVSIAGGHVLTGDGAFFIDTAGASYLFKLSGYAAKLKGVYISNATNCSQAAIVVDDGRICEVSSVDILNCVNGIRLKSTSAGTNGFGCTRTKLSNIAIDTCTGIGIDTQTNVSETNAVNVYVDNGTISGGGASIPRTSSTGFSFVGTGAVVATGGHLFANCTAINGQTGWVFTNTNLIKLVNCIGDTLSGPAYLFNGNTNAMDLVGCFAGTCQSGVTVAGTAASIAVSSFRTYDIGVIPGYGGTTWYSSAGFSAPFYDLVQQATASMTVDLDSWIAKGTNAHTLVEAVSNSIQFTGGFRINFNSASTLAAGTYYLAGSVAAASADLAAFVVPITTKAIKAVMRAFSNTAPGGANTYVYTLNTLVLGDTSIIGTTTGAQFAATFVGVDVGILGQDSVCMKLVATGASAIHRGYILLIPQPS